jgi:HSP20 family protein
MFVRLDVPETLDCILEDFALNGGRSGCMAAFPAIDIAEDEKQTVVTAELPGVKKEDLKIAFEKSVLTISGKRKAFELPENARMVMNEIGSREFSRSVEFDHDVDADKISAEMKDGLLHVVLPKAETSRARAIEVK